MSGRQPMGADFDNQVVRPPRTIGSCDRAPGPFRVVLDNQVAIEISPLFDLAGKTFEACGIEASRGFCAESYLSSGSFWNGEKAFSHVEHAETPRVPHVMQGGITAIE